MKSASARRDELINKQNISKQPYSNPNISNTFLPQQAPSTIQHHQQNTFCSQSHPIINHPFPENQFVKKTCQDISTLKNSIQETLSLCNDFVDIYGPFPKPQHNDTNSSHTHNQQDNYPPKHPHSAHKRNPQTKTHCTEQLIAFDNDDQDDVTTNITPTNQPNFASTFTPRISIAQALNLIPYFDGNPEKLRVFCSAIRQLLHTFGTGSEPYVRVALASKLTGHAASVYSARIYDFPTIESFLIEITKQYSDSSMADHILSLIKQTKQRPNEPAADYGQRMQAYLCRLQAIYDSAADLTDTDREMRKRTAEIETLQIFLFNLNSPLDILVRCERPISLSDAIRIAIQFEARRNSLPAFSPHHISHPAYGNQHSEQHSLPAHTSINMLNSQPAPISLLDLPPLTRPLLNESANIYRTTTSAPRRTNCAHCGSSMHTTQFCREKTSTQAQCNYCKRPGHSVANCRTLEFDIHYGRTIASNLRQNSAYNTQNTYRRTSGYNNSYNSQRRYPSNNNQRNYQSNSPNLQRRNYSPNNRSPRSPSPNNQNENAAQPNTTPLNSYAARRNPQASSAAQ